MQYEENFDHPGACKTFRWLLDARRAGSDGQEVFGLQAGAADQRAAHLGQGQQAGGVAGLYRAAIENFAARAGLAELRHEGGADGGVHGGHVGLGRGRPVPMAQTGS